MSNVRTARSPVTALELSGKLDRPLRCGRSPSASKRMAGARHTSAAQRPAAIAAGGHSARQIGASICIAELTLKLRVDPQKNKKRFCPRPDGICCHNYVHSYAREVIMDWLIGIVLRKLIYCGNFGLEPRQDRHFGSVTASGSPSRSAS
jgi:hypothetical protein